MGRAGSLEALQATLRKKLWIPDEEKYQPSQINLEQTFNQRQKIDRDSIDH